MKEMKEKLSSILPEIAMQLPNSNILDEKQKILPFKTIPNVRKFRVDLGEYDELFKKHGIDRRQKPEFVYEKFFNHRSNRYIK